MTVFSDYAQYYDLIYADKDYPGEAAFVQYLLTAQVPSCHRILDLGCGTGRHAECLWRAGFEIHGVDRSPDMIAQACRRLGPSPAAGIHFELGDARSARLGKTFDAVISLFHVASYQIGNQDIASIFDTAAHHLRSDGVFIFDCWYGPAVLHDPPSVRIKRVTDDAYNVVRIAEPTLHPNENRVDIDYSIIAMGRRSAISETIFERHEIRYFFLPELRLLLDGAGFRLVRAFEWMSEAPLSTSTWSMTIIAARH